MPSLINKKTDQVLANNVIILHSFFSRVKGLMGKKDLPPSTAFWILPCIGGIHTLFMRFPIDVIFVNYSLKITAVFTNIAPWKTVVHPGLFSKTYSVFELKSPALEKIQLQKGDQLYVGH